MRVFIQDVSKHITARGINRWLVFYEFDRWTQKADGRCHTWSDWEASLCQRAKDQYQTVELEIESTAWGPRVQAVSLSQPHERKAASA